MCCRVRLKAALAQADALSDNLRSAGVCSRKFDRSSNRVVMGWGWNVFLEMENLTNGPKTGAFYPANADWFYYGACEGGRAVEKRYDAPK